MTSRGSIRTLSSGRPGTIAARPESAAPIAEIRTSSRNPPAARRDRTRGIASNAAQDRTDVPIERRRAGLTRRGSRKEPGHPEEHQDRVGWTSVGDEFGPRHALGDRRNQRRPPIVEDRTDRAVCQLPSGQDGSP